MSRTLYVSDLDGTLLRDDKTMSAYTVDTIRAFTARGGLLTFCTARSIYSAGQLTAPLGLRGPAATYNGAAIADIETGALLHTRTVDAQAMLPIVRYLAQISAATRVVGIVGGKQRLSMLRGDIRPDMPDPRLRAVDAAEALLDGAPFYLTFEAPRAHCDALAPLLAHPALCCHAFPHPDRDEIMVDVAHHEGTKGHALRLLRDMVGADRAVCFGDADNDLSMFAAADACYAVSGAVDALARAATGSIGGNNDDGVARFLAGISPSS